MIRRSKWWGFTLLAGLMVACGTTQELVGEDHGPRRKPEQMMEVLDSLSQVSVGNFYSKINTRYQDSSKNVSFKTSLRIVNDSAVNAIITYASIPMVNALITPDSVRVTNRRDKCYIERDLLFFREEFGVDFSYENIEELFLGKPVGYNKDEEYYRIHEQGLGEYTVCSHKKKEIRKNERNNVREIITYYTLDDSLSNLQSMRILSPEDSTMIEVQYRQRELIEGYMLPEHIEVVINAPRQQINIDLEYRKTHINRPEEVHFVIPENYEKCQ